MTRAATWREELVITADRFGRDMRHLYELYQYLGYDPDEAMARLFHENIKLMKEK